MNAKLNFHCSDLDSIANVYMLVVVIVLHILTRLWSNSVTVGAMLIITCRLASSTELDNYTVNHKNVSSLFLIITLAFLGRFLYFLYGWKRERILYKQVNKIYHITLTVPPHYLVKLKPCKTAHFEVNHSAFDRTSLQHLQKVVQCSYIPIVW